MNQAEKKATLKSYCRKQGVFCFVPEQFRQAFWEIAEEQRSGSFSQWIRPKLLRWLAEERPNMRAEIEAYLHACEIVWNTERRRGGSMQNNGAVEE